MSMGIVSDEDFDKEVDRVNKLPEIISLPEKGRGNGNKQVPDSLRKIIGETNELDSRQEALTLARSFGISDSSVSAYANGSTSTSSYHNPNSELKNHINESTQRIQKKARARLFDALKHITEEKLSEAKLRDVASVARDMSAIVKDFSPEEQLENNNNRPQFVIYAPTFRKEESFDVIVVKE